MPGTPRSRTSHGGGSAPRRPGRPTTKRQRAALRAGRAFRRIAGKATGPARRTARRVGGHVFWQLAVTPYRRLSTRLRLRRQTPYPTTAARSSVWRRAARTARTSWQRFLRGTGLQRSAAYRRAARIAATGWEDFLRGTGLIDPDATRTEVPGAIPGPKPLTSPDPAPTTPTLPPLPPPPGGAPVPTHGRTSTMTAPGPGTPGNIFQPLIEAAHQIGGSWRPVNANDEAAAQEMRKMVRDLPEAFQALAAMYQAMTSSCTDTIAMETGTADLLRGAERYVRMPVQPLLENASQMDRPHDDDVRRVQTPNPLLNAWNWDRNQGYPDMH